MAKVNHRNENCMEKKTMKKSKTKDDPSTKRFSKKYIASIITVILIFISFFILGYFVSLLIMKNDGFTLNNCDKNIKIEVNDKYIEEGAKVISFGRDISEYLVIKILDERDVLVSDVDTSYDTKYTIIYSLKTPKGATFFDKLLLNKYENYTQVRIITVGEGANE